MAEMFPLFKNNDNIEEGLSDKCKSILSKCNNPHIICFYGDARLGKSTKLNQIINGTISDNYYSLHEPFKTKLEIHTTQTKGCDFYGPVKVKDLIDRNEIDIKELEGFDKNNLNDELFFVDTEGLKSIDIVTKTCITGILTILQIASIKILYIPILLNEKFDEAAKNSKLSNILKLFDNESETIVLIRDVILSDEFNNYHQINEDLKNQKPFFIEKIGNYFKQMKAKNPISDCELLPSFEKAKNNNNDYSISYKMQMSNLISTFLLKIKNNNINGSKLIEIINELLDIFKQVEDIEIMRNTDNALDSILKRTFEQKVKKLYLEIKEQINQCNAEILKLENNNEEIKNYLIKYIKDEIKDIWDMYYDSIKSEIDNIIENYRFQINIEILKTSKKIEENINAEINSLLKISGNEDINEFFSKFTFFEQINKNDIDILIKKIMDNFFNKFEKEFKCFSEDYKIKIQKHLKNCLEENMNCKIKSMQKRENYLINVFEDIKNKVSNAFLLALLKKDKKEIEQNLDLNVLKQKIDLYIAQNAIIGHNEEDFKKKLNELYEEIKIKLKERMKSIDFEKFLEAQLKGRSILDGIYLIKPISCQNKVVHMDNNNLVIHDFNNENKQKFEIKYDSNQRYYAIQNVENGQFLTCDDSSIFFTGKNNNTSQQWHIVYNEIGGYEIILEKNKKLIQIEENDNNEIKVSCQKKEGKPKQIFNFESTVKTILPPNNDIPKRIVKINYFPKPNFHGIYNDINSIVDALAGVGYPNDKPYREKIGIRNNIPGVPFTKSYNTHMLNLMKAGKLIIP